MSVQGINKYIIKSIRMFVSEMLLKEMVLNININIQQIISKFHVFSNLQNDIKFVTFVKNLNIFTNRQKYILN